MKQHGKQHWWLIFFGRRTIKEDCELHGVVPIEECEILAAEI